MTSRIALWSLIVTAAFAAPLRAQTIEITPFIGYETAGDYPLQNPGDIQALRADAARSYGLFFDYRIMQNVQAEFLWINNATTYSAARTNPDVFTPAFSTTINQYQAGALYHLRGRDAAFRPYIAASLGVTHDSNNGAFPDRSAFSFSAGGGLKYDASGHVGARIDARWMPTYGSSQIGNVCDFEGFCYPDSFASYLNRISLTAGLIIRL